MTWRKLSKASSWARIAWSRLWLTTEYAWSLPSRIGGTKVKITFEEMRKAEYQGYTIRMWFDNEKGLLPAARFDDMAVEVMKTFISLYDLIFFPQITCSDLIRLYPTLNAIEIVDNKGNGTVAYRDWP